MIDKIIVKITQYIVMLFFIIIILIYFVLGSCYSMQSIHELSPNHRFEAYYVYESCGVLDGYRQSSVSVTGVSEVVGSHDSKNEVVYDTDDDVVEELRWASDNKLIVLTNENPNHAFTHKTQVTIGGDTIAIEYHTLHLEPRQ